MVVFAVDRADGGVSMISQTAGNSLEWSDWVHLGGEGGAGGGVVGQDLDGRLEVFWGERGRRGRWMHNWQTDLRGALGGVGEPGGRACARGDGGAECGWAAGMVWGERGRGFGALLAIAGE